MVASRFGREMLGLESIIIVVWITSALMQGCMGAPDGNYRPTEIVGGFCLIKTSADQVIISEDPRIGGAPMIPAKVVQVAVIGKMILAKQIAESGGSPTASNGKEGLWMLDTKSRTLDGPMSQSEFDEIVKTRFSGQSITFADAE